jgi:alpha-mannosidase
MKNAPRSAFYGALLIIGVFYFGLTTASAQQKRIFIAPDDHTDYMWTADETTYRNAFLTMTDFYLNRMDATAGNPAPYQARWNCDGSFWMWIYERNRTPAQFERFINRIRTGHLSVPLNSLPLVNGGTPAEAVLRGMMYPGIIERRYNVRFPIAVAMENQAMSYGLPSLWAGAGAKYSWKGVCGCATQVSGLQARDREIYYCGGADGSRVLMKWNSLFDGNQSIGGYAEARNPVEAVNFVSTNSNFISRYPYQIIGAFGQGWDDLQTTNDDFIAAAQQQTNASRQVIVSNQLDFFQEFEMAHGANLETYSASFGNEWELLTASMAEVSARVKRAAEKLRTAEAMATLVSLQNPAFMNSRTNARDTAMINFGLYFDHNWTADGPVSRSDRAAWQRRIEGDITSYVNTLETDAKVALGSYIRKSGANQRVFVFNSLSWTRTDYADFPYSNTNPVHVVDLTTGLETPSQIVTVDGQRRLRIFAQNIPSVGYKVFEIRAGAGQTFSNAATASGTVIENDFYRITLANTGAVTSLIDKTRGNREMVRTINGRTLNDFGISAGGTIAVENAGAVTVTLRATSTAAPNHTTRITLIRNSPRIEIRNDITQNFGDVRTWAYSFELNQPDVWHEEVGAVIRAKLLANGGHYAPRNARYDWLTMNHFAAMTDGANSVGVTLSSADNYFMKLGGSTPALLDTATPQINVLAGGQVDGDSLGIPDQNGDSQFLQRFALTTHGAFNRVEAMRFALEHQNPLAVGEVTGTNVPNARPQSLQTEELGYNPNSLSFLTLSDPNVLLWSLKPAEDGITQGVAARVWNLADTGRNYALSLSREINSARRVTHIETDIAAATVTNGDLTASINQQQIQTHLLKLNLPAAATASITGRITTGARGIGKVIVTLTDAQSGVTLQALTDGNGNYRFDNVPTGGEIVLTPQRRAYSFTPSSQTFTHLAPRTDTNFAARARMFGL